jgi:hypothetical protein
MGILRGEAEGGYGRSAKRLWSRCLTIRLTVVPNTISVRRDNNHDSLLALASDSAR